MQAVFRGARARRLAKARVASLEEEYAATMQLSSAARVAQKGFRRWVGGPVALSLCITAGPAYTIPP